MARRGTGQKLWRWCVASAAFLFVYLFAVYLTLPDVRTLRTQNPATTAFIELRQREARSDGKKPRRVQQWTGYSRISSTLTRAVLVAEDSAFYQHEGLDYEQIRESLEINLDRLEFTRGASTITQQLAKNLYLSPSKDPVRKVRELFITRDLEAALTKRRILELYLNVIEWGDGIYGIEAAARTYFGVSAASLSAEQSALLAGAIINPRVLTPARPTRRLLRRQRLILQRMGRVTPPRPVESESVVEPSVPPLKTPDPPPIPEPIPFPPSTSTTSVP